MLIDPVRTIVLLPLYAGFNEDGTQRWSRPKRSVMEWCQRTFPDENIRGYHHSPVVCARNRPIRDLVLPESARFDWVIGIEHDVTITYPGVENWLKVPGDVVACECRMAGGENWREPHAFHLPLWRARIEVFQRIPPPWFWFPYSPDGCELLSCECAWFRDRCLEAGFDVRHGGHCGHDCYGAATSPECAAWHSKRPGLYCFEFGDAVGV